MSETRPTTILCISSYFKGEAFIRACKEAGCRVFLLTAESIAHEPWPRESIDEFFQMPDLTNLQHLTNAVTYLCRQNQVDRIIALDEFDLENVALLREHLLLPGMSYTATRNFRDKLKMRMLAREAGIREAEFVPVLQHANLIEFMNRIPAPWVLKPRTSAGAIGIKKIHNQDELWHWLDQLGDDQSNRLLEQYIPGDVYHVDSVVWDGKILFASSQKYGNPPLNVSHEGGVFSTRTLDNDSEDAIALREINERVIKTLGLKHGVTHAEYIKAHADGQFNFLEIAARVGGAHIADMIEAATGINLWAEWARIEIALARGEKYKLPKAKPLYGGLLVSLAKQDYPDLSAYSDPEVVWRMHKLNHAGLVVASKDATRVETLLNQYKERFVQDFLAVAPPLDRATH